MKTVKVHPEATLKVYVVVNRKGDAVGAGLHEGGRDADEGIIDEWNLLENFLRDDQATRIYEVQVTIPEANVPVIELTDDQVTFLRYHMDPDFPLSEELKEIDRDMESLKRFVEWSKTHDREDD